MKSYFKFLFHNKLYTAIEVFGLSVALGFVIILASYAHMEYNVGKQSESAKDIYAVGMGDCIGMTWGTPQEFFPSIPGIKEWTRTSELNMIKGVKVGSQYYNINALAIDSNFFKMFDIGLEGCPRDRVLGGNNEVLLSKSFAAKVFGSENPIGKSLLIKMTNEDKDQLYRVTGIVEDSDKRSIFKPCDIMLPMKLKEQSLARMDNFGEVIPFVRLAKGADPDKIAETLLEKYLKYWPDTYKREGDFIWGSTLTRLDDIYFSKVNNWQLRHGDKSLVNILLVIALVLLFSAIFNYINLTVAQAGKRAKEMATRRLLGESVTGVVMRYFKESAVFTTFSFLIGLLLSLILLPLFDSILDTKISLAVSPLTILYTIVGILAMSFICGIVPAIMVSRLSPIDIVRGSLQLKSKLWFSKAFIIAQGVVSTVLIAVGMAMVMQIHYVATYPLGYNTEDLFMMGTMDIGTDIQPQRMLADRLKALPEVEDAIPSGGTPLLCGANGVHNGEETIGWLRMPRMDVASMKLYGIKIIEQYCEPTGKKIWISESGKRHFNVSERNQFIGMQNGKPEREVCGVINDFRAGGALAEDMDNEFCAIQVLKSDDYYYIMTVKTIGDHDKAYAAINKVYSQVAKELTGMPYDMDGKYIDDYLTDYAKTERNTMTLVLTFMMVSILISALGMFAMSVYYSDQQRRQIALRKVMGATTANAVWTLSKRFLVMAAVSIVIASPISVKIIANYLQDFPRRIDFPWWVIPAAALFTLVIAFVSVISRTLKVATSNSVESIKTE